MGWSLVDPQYVATLIGWWAVDAWVRLSLIALLIRALQPQRELKKPASVLAAALNAEALLDARSGIWGLIGLVPALALLAVAGIESFRAQLGILALAAVGLIPATTYFLRRSLASAGLLLGQVQRGAEALDWSAERLNVWRPFLRLALPWWALGWALDGGTLILGNVDSWAAAGLGWALGVPSLLCALMPIALFVAPDETL
jgi:hypothetical protein